MAHPIDIPRRDVTLSLDWTDAVVDALRDEDQADNVDVDARPMTDRAAAVLAGAACLAVAAAGPIGYLLATHGGTR